MTDPRTDGPDRGPEHDDLPAALREALDSMKPTEPDPDFRDRLRGAFVAGDLQCSDTAVESALGDWEVPPADPAFRARCRDAFLATAAPAAEPAPARGRLLRFLPLAAAAAAAALLVPGLLGGKTGDGVQRLVINGAPVVQTDAPDHDLGALLGAGGSCSVEDDSEPVLLRYGDDLLVEADAGASFDVDLDVPATEPIGVALRSGAVRVSHRDGDRRGVAIRTADVVVTMRGQAIGMDREEGRGTCICCLAGEVDVAPVRDGMDPFTLSSGDSAWLGAGDDQWRVYRGEVHHRGSLEDLRETARTYFY